jgi:hypothetical protein
MAGAMWRERRRAWFLRALLGCYDLIADVHSGERYASLEEWRAATGLDEREFAALYAEAWDDNLIAKHGHQGRRSYATGEIVREGYSLTADGGAFLGFLETEEAEGRYRKQPIPSDLRWAVWERDDFTCRECGTRRDLSVDHIVPESKGGAMTPENLQTLCRPCNSRKGAR